MAKLDKIVLRNFKAFYGEETIEIGGKHLLMYGENGSGKSSIYWALYTVLQSVLKEVPEVQKYFKPKGNESLVNINFIEDRKRVDEETGETIYPDSIGKNAFVELIFDDERKIRIDSDGLSADGNEEFLQELNERSDFISHRLLTNFYNFKNSERIDLWNVFDRDILPFIKDKRGNGENTLADNLAVILKDKNKFKAKKIVKVDPDELEKHQKSIENFNSDLEYWLDEINTIVNQFYKENFLFSNEAQLLISIKAYKKLSLNRVGLEDSDLLLGLSLPILTLNVEIQNQDGTTIPIKKPQSYFNEARLTRIGLAVRFTLLLEFIRPEFDGKTLVLDDLLISLDMSNRNRVLDIILKNFASKYRILFFTHSLEFFRFCDYKIRQNGLQKDWEIKEIYFDEDSKTPEIIDSQLDYLKRAEHYYKKKDYIASTVFLRKEIERFIKERVSEEYQYQEEDKHHTLDHLWKLLVDRYRGLGHHIAEDVQNAFKQSKLMVLNPSAHDNLSQRIYRIELVDAFELVDKLEESFPPYKRTLVLKGGTALEFKHPDHDYVFEFSFKSDLLIDHIENELKPNNPKCNIISWSYEGQEFYDFKKERVLNSEEQKKAKEKQTKFKKIIEGLSKMEGFGIDDEMFMSNTFLKDSNLSLKSILKGFEIDG